MSDDSVQKLTLMIQGARESDGPARHRLYEAIYHELKQIARGVYGVGSPGDTLQPTVLAAELFIEFDRKFPAPPENMPESRRTFFRSVALAMRTIVRDHARSKSAVKRGGPRRALCLEESIFVQPNPADADPSDLLALDEALDELERFNERWAELVLHRYYAGRSISQTAAMMGRAESSVSRDWSLAKAWLERRLESDTPEA